MTSRAWTRRPRPAACESISSRATAAIASAARSPPTTRTGTWASDNFTGSDVQARGLAVPGTIKANGDFNPGFGGPIKRDKLWFFLSGRSLFADNYVASTFFNLNANKLDRFDYLPSTDQAILHQEQTIYQARLTWQATPKTQVRDDVRSGELLRVHDRHRPGTRRCRDLARGRQRPPFPAAALRHHGLEHAGQQQAARSKPAAFTASNAGAAWSRRWASWATSTTWSPA